MAQGGNNNNFLSIPSQEGLFKTVRVDRSEENSNDEDEEETEEDVRLIPRSSPVPRKRGSSIADETAEYMRIRLALTDRRVSFADSAGAELVDVRMFAAFDSDEEDDSRWEEEEAKYRKAYREPTYRLWPEFQALTGPELLLAVHTNKLEVESVTPVPDEPLSFEVVIRVLNISFHKSVYVRSTMDGWINHFDYPAEYVLGSNDGETDKFTVNLSFAPPYLFNGARIDFVVRYETSDGEFWANNSGRNYSVTLIQSYEEDPAQNSTAEKAELRGILKPPRYRTAASGYDDSDDRDGDNLSSTECEAAEDQACFTQPNIVHPEIDIETAKNLSSSPESAKTSSMAGCSLTTSDTPSREPLALESMSSNNSPKIEESGLPLSIPFSPQSQESQQASEAQDPVYNDNVLPSVFLSVPAVLVHTYDRPETNNPNHLPYPQNEVLAQVPFKFGQPLMAGFPETPHIQEEGVKDFQENDVVEIKDRFADIQKETKSQDVDETYIYRSEDPKHPFSKEVKAATEDVEKLNLCLENPLEEQGLKDFQVKDDVVEIHERLADIQEEPSQNIEIDKTYIHRSEDPEQHPSSKEVNIASKDVNKLSLSEGLENPLEEGPKDIHEKEDVAQMGDRLATLEDILEEPSQYLGDQSYIHRLKEPKQHPSSIQVNVVTEDVKKIILSESLENPLDNESKQPPSSILVDVTEDVKLKMSSDTLEEGLKEFLEDVEEINSRQANIREEPSHYKEDDTNYSNMLEEPKPPSPKEMNIATDDVEKLNLAESFENPLDAKHLKDMFFKESLPIYHPAQNLGDKTLIQVFEEPQQPSKELINITTEDVENLSFSGGLENPLEEEFQEQEVDQVSSARVDLESGKTGDEERDELVTSCLLPPYSDTTACEREPQILLLDPAPARQEEGLLDPSILASVLPEDLIVEYQTISMCTSEHPASQPEKPELVSGSETSPRAFDLQPSTVQTSAGDDLASKADEPSNEACKDFEPQQTLPRVGSELSQISKDQTEATLSTCLMVFATFFSAVICLAVGIQDPRAFLCVGLLLLSLWF